ncbi:MAG: hypothetical protein AAGE01_04520 [Pseudomonadota bacterium]
MRRLKFDVFGREVHIERRGDRWQAYYPGNDGKRRPAPDIIIPASIAEAELLQYLDDLCHEWATPGNAAVRRTE